ncbi:Pre-rRNA-processing protein TSR1 homolog [Eumeta japonica]|uniref:Pre-rRNA-processing protein TSR1 homolog n=1 Tax=Eumeta variegata TaxID=151549 RepID=A0A4C2AH11_EUMVA|nr:Pre-rRNA-processing protein TSR1 homolog [Eumeta japonica]
MISAQTIPTPIVALMDLESLNPKRRSSAKAAAQKFISKLLPKEKIMQMDTNSEDHVEFVPNRNDAEDEGCLKVTGFLRGTPLDVNGLVHIVGLGYSAYQAAWIPDVEAVEANSSEDEGMDNNDDVGESDEDDEDEFMSCDNKSFDDEFEKPESDSEEYIDSASVSDAAMNDEKYDLQMDLHEERETMKKLKEARIDEMWPDEIDTPLDMPARTRFQKFRGLESFRTSPWDPKENLPSDYARIYQFKNFDRTKRRIINEAKEIDGVLVRRK